MLLQLRGMIEEDQHGCVSNAPLDMEYEDNRTEIQP